MEVKWVYAKYKSDAGIYEPYITSLLDGETLDDAIKRIKSANPSIEFTDFTIKTEQIWL